MASVPRAYALFYLLSATPTLAARSRSVNRARSILQGSTPKPLAARLPRLHPSFAMRVASRPLAPVRRLLPGASDLPNRRTPKSGLHDRRRRLGGGFPLFLTFLLLPRAERFHRGMKIVVSRGARDLFPYLTANHAQAPVALDP